MKITILEYNTASLLHRTNNGNKILVNKFYRIALNNIQYYLTNKHHSTESKS